MAFAVGGNGKRVAPSMNVTPLVDVVLVLLIIFMVITPMMTRQFKVNLPAKDDNEQPAAPSPDEKPPVVLSLDASGAISLNREPITDAELPERLQRVFAARGENLLFFAAHDDAPYGRAMEVMDRARGGGAATIAIVTEPLQ